MKNRKNFMNIQLFAENDGENSTQSGNETQNGATNSQTEQPKMVAKDLFDKTSSELADYKKKSKELENKIKELENKGKTDEQLTAEKLAEQETKLKEATLKLNKATAVGILAEQKAKIGLDDKKVVFDSIFDYIVSDDETKTTENATYFAKLLQEVYQKGCMDSSNNRFNNVAKDTNVQGSSQNSSDFKKFNERFNSTNGRVELK